jgi:mono/diheme cytochrome c family protein
VKKILLGVVGLLAIAALGGFVFFKLQVRAYDESMAKRYDIPLVAVQLSDDAQVLARGKHLTEALGACTACHGDNFGGGRAEKMGPMGKLVYPNVTGSKDGALSQYTDAELMRLLRHGVRRDGTSVHMMPMQEMAWWPDSDRIAIISYLRRVQPVAGQPGVVEFTGFAKLLDRLDKVPIDVARRIDHTVAPPAEVAPAETAEYGKMLAVSCRGCHGEHLSGGHIAGTPPDLATPLNLTPHETGLKGWSYDDFVKVVRTGQRRDGRQLDPFMPIAALRNFNQTELKALWAYLQTVPPMELGQR